MISNKLRWGLVTDILTLDCIFGFRLYPKECPITVVRHFAAPGRIPYSEAVKGDFKETKVGNSFGPL